MMLNHSVTVKNSHTLLGLECLSSRTPYPHVNQSAITFLTCLKSRVFQLHLHLLRPEVYEYLYIFGNRLRALLAAEESLSTFLQTHVVVNEERSRLDFLFPFTPKKKNFVLSWCPVFITLFSLYSWQMYKVTTFRVIFPVYVFHDIKAKDGRNHFRGVRRKGGVHIISSRRSSISPDGASSDGVCRTLAGVSLLVPMFILTAMVT